MVDPSRRQSPAARTGEPTEAEAWALLLTVTGLGPAGFGALLREHGGGRAILDAAARPGAAAAFAATAEAADGRTAFGLNVGRAIVELARTTDEPLQLLRDSGVTIVTLDDPGYPPRLRAIDLPPPVLFVQGEVAALAANQAVAVVGTRRATERGRLAAARLAAAIAKAGAVIVSGLAVGIDGSAHAAVVHEGRPTIAVLGSGHRYLYPRAHARLARGILATGGAVVSEMWPGDEPAPGTFPRRNRLISGLSSATIVVEAGEKSGALITADWALKQGRDCFFVPGPLFEPRSAGCLQWLHRYPDAAKIVAGIPELIDDLGLFDAATGTPLVSGQPSLDATLIELGPTAREVARALLATQGTLDELVAVTGHETATVLGAITLLELRGLATTTYGRYRAAGRLASAAPS
ncbi:MAG TPA: DNA-processing protein DprA [Candidatus Bathyarchaeia archaeon]|nr:DNA-processing protein DprA [Candidatus Bathyarchaeia archaeon]